MSTHSVRLRKLRAEPNDKLASQCMWHILRGQRLEAELMRLRAALYEIQDGHPNPRALAKGAIGVVKLS